MSDEEELQIKSISDPARGGRQLWQILKDRRKCVEMCDTGSEVTWDLWVWDSKVISAIKGS